MLGKKVEDNEGAIAEGKLGQVWLNGMAGIAEVGGRLLLFGMLTPGAPVVRDLVSRPTGGRIIAADPAGPLVVTRDGTVWTLPRGADRWEKAMDLLAEAQS